MTMQAHNGAQFALPAPELVQPDPRAQHGFFGLPLPPFLQGLPLPGMPQGLPGIPGAFASALGVCGTAHVEGVDFSLDCMTENYARIPWAAVAVLPRRIFGSEKGFAGAARIPEMVDHRSQGLEGVVRNQGQAGSCTAASLASVIDQAVAAGTGSPGNVSILHLWSRYHTPSMEAAASGNRSKSLTVESIWPYDAGTACSWMADCELGECTKLRVTCAEGPDSKALAHADAKSSWQLRSITGLQESSTEAFQEVLAKGKDLWFAMYVGDAFARFRGKGVIPDFDARASRAGHAMAIVGYKTQANGTYFLIKNSWGPKWGDQGYAWMHEDTLLRNIRYAPYIVEVGPAQSPAVPGPGPTPTRPPSPPKPPPRPPSVCQTGLVPDSITGFCRPPCHDGSPRAAEFCPAPNQCPPGYVNLFGFCTVAPASTQGSHPETGISFRCASGGCTYFIPMGRFGCTSQPQCVHACPAPAYALAAGPEGLSCTE